MREIKFRAYDIYSNDVVSIKTIDLEADGSVGCVVDFDDINLDVSECVLMQYTGLKDKNGVEIYEGDIYRYRYYFSNDTWEYRNRVVKYSSVEIEYQGLFHGYEFDESNIEVIGNIYENPELLETKKSS